MQNGRKTEGKKFFALAHVDIPFIHHSRGAVREKKEKKREILLAYLISRVNGEEFAFSERIPADRLLKPVIAHMYAQLCS